MKPKLLQMVNQQELFTSGRVGNGLGARSRGCYQGRRGGWPDAGSKTAFGAAGWPLKKGGLALAELNGSCTPSFTLTRAGL